MTNNPIVLDDLGQHVEVAASKLTGYLTIRPDMVPLVNGDRTAGLTALMNAASASGINLFRLSAGTYDGIGRLNTPDFSVLELNPGATLVARPLTSAEKTQEAQDVTNAGADYYWPVVDLGNGARIHGGGRINGLKAIRPFAHGVRYANRAERGRVRLEIFNCGGDAVFFVNSHKFQVERCDLHDCDGRGIHGTISNTARIHMNRIDNVQHGIQWWGDATNGICTGWSVTGNIVTNCVNTTQNGVNNPGGGGIWGHLGQRMALSGNTIDKCDDVGIDFETSYDSSANGNTVSDCKNAAIAVFYASKRITFSGNVIVQGAGMGPGFKAYGSGMNSDIQIQGGTITTTDPAAHGVFTDAGVCEDLTVDGVIIICNGGATPVATQDCHRTNVINCFKLQTSGPLGIDVRGGSNGRQENNTLYYTGTDSANARGIRIYWRSGSYPAKNNLVRRNKLVGFGAGIYDDNNGDAASGTVFEDNITPSIAVNISPGWTGRMRGNRNDAGTFVDRSIYNTLPDGFAPKAAGRLTWNGTGFDSVVETLTGITNSTAGTFYIPVLTMPGSSAGSYDHSLFQVSLGKWAGNNKKIYTVKAGQRDAQSITYQCFGNHAADGTLMAFQNTTTGDTTFYLVVGPNYEYGVRYLLLNQSTPVSSLVSSTSLPTGTKVFDTNTSAPVAEFGDSLRTKGFDVQTKRSYTPTSTTDATGATGDQTYDANNVYLKTAGGWVATPTYPLGYYPLGIPVATKTIAGIQAVYDAIPDGSTVDVLLSGTYLRQGTESLNVISNKKTVRFVSYNNARIHDPNNTATSASLVFINNQIGGGWDGVHFSTASNYTSFNYGIVFINETAPVVNYTFRNGSVTGPAFLGNGITVQAWSDQNNGGAGGGCIHRNILVENFTFFKLGRMGLEWTCHNEKESGRPTRIFDVTVQRCTFDDLGLVVKDGMGCSFSGSLENVVHINNTYVDCKQYCVEFIGTRSGMSKANKMSGGKLWGNDPGGTGTNLTNGYNFTDGQNAGLGAKNLTIVGDDINVQGRPMLAYGCANLTFKFGTWRGGVALDFNQGGGNGVAGDHCSNITLQTVDITIQGSVANNVIVINNSDIVKVLDCNMRLVGTNCYSVFNAEANSTQVTLSGGHWSRPKTAQDNMYNVRATNSPAVGTHYESTF